MSTHKRKPESEMMSYGYEPMWSEGAVKSPIFQTSTFVFRTAEEGKHYFELAYGLAEAQEKEALGLIYSRLNHPNLEILENRLALWEQAEAASVHDSGMAAITTAVFTFLKPGMTLLHAYPLYGGTAHFFAHVLPEFGITCIPFTVEDNLDTIQEKMVAHKVDARSIGMIYVETPANPTNDLFDLLMLNDWRDHFNHQGAASIVAVDNTYMGPIWQQPIQLGCDLSIYSATKYLGGHSDLIAGAILGNANLIKSIKTYRTFMGNAPSPNTCWLLMRSLETLKIRMEAQQQHAIKVADFLDHCSDCAQMSYVGKDILHNEKSRQIFERQMSGTGAMISFDVIGGENEAFQFLNNLRMIKLAVSLGSTESLAQHPFTMTHASMPTEEKLQLGIRPSTIRLSIGLEHPDDIIQDLKQAFMSIKVKSTGI